jgi:tRNA threonylcarbamoyladenosine modification (KEOPS) complex Cgi121 subunit
MMAHAQPAPSLQMRALNFFQKIKISSCTRKGILIYYTTVRQIRRALIFEIRSSRKQQDACSGAEIKFLFF